MTSRSTIPAHVLTHLIATGKMTENRLTKKATYRYHRCGLLLIAGINDDYLMETWLWPLPTTPAGELTATLHSIPTFETAIGETIRYRNAARITRRDADTTSVYIEHTCGHPAPDINWPRIPPCRRRPHSVDDEPPY